MSVAFAEAHAGINRHLFARDVRFQLEVRSPILESGPIIEQESTRIYGPAQAAPPPGL